MANTSKSITRAAAIDFALGILHNEDAKAFGCDALNLDADMWGKACAVIERMAAQMAKEKARSANGEKVETPEQRLNRKLADEVHAFMVKRYNAADAAGELGGEDESAGLTSSTVIRDEMGDPNISSTQKAVSLMRILIADGRAERVMVGSKTYYSPIVKDESEQ